MTDHPPSFAPDPGRSRPRANDAHKTSEHRRMPDAQRSPGRSAASHLRTTSDAPADPNPAAVPQRRSFRDPYARRGTPDPSSSSSRVQQSGGSSATHADSHSRADRGGPVHLGRASSHSSGTQSSQQSSAHNQPAEPTRRMPSHTTPRNQRHQPPSFLPADQVRQLQSQRAALSGTNDDGTPATPRQQAFHPPRQWTIPERSHPAQQYGSSGPYGSSEPSSSSARDRARPRRRRHRRWPLVLVIILVLIIGWPAFLVWDANQHLGRVDALTTNADTPGTTYLLVGSDSRADGAVADGTEGARADSILLINVAPNSQATAISLPRDTYVSDPDYGDIKLNAAYSLGGPNQLVATVESLTGLTVDHYVEIGMGGVGTIVDALGGINLCLDMDVNDELSELNWQAGCHDADGRTALAFSRMRYSDPLGDIGRAERQRQVITKTISTALSPSVLLNPIATLRVERAGASSLTADKSAYSTDLARLVWAFKSASDAQLMGAPPIESMGFEIGSGSAVLLRDTTAPEFFAKVARGQITPEDLNQLDG